MIARATTAAFILMLVSPVPSLHAASVARSTGDEQAQLANQI